jgi:SNF2 family DNA or RNA helicase
VLPLDSVIVSGWLETALERLHLQQPLLTITEPKGFVGELRAYQRRGVGWLAHLRQLGLGACLADDMGLGKTIQAIALLLYVRNEAVREYGPDARLVPTLLICPTSVVANWRREIERFAPELRTLVHHGNNRLAGEDFVEAVRTHDLIITSYGTARRDIEMLKDYVWSDLILDEAQNIKTPSAKQTQAVRRLLADSRIALTGTPVENRLSELWSIMEFLNPGYLSRQEQFRQRYIVPIERYNDGERTDELRRLVQPFLLRRLKSDPTIISDLPEKNEMVVYCSLTREQAALYEKVVQESLNELNRTDGIQRRGLVLALLTKLKQITNHPAHFLKENGPLGGRSGKLNRLGEMLEEAVAVGDRALIFTQFVEMGHLLQRHLAETLGVEALFLHGSTPATQRDKLVQAFQSEDGPPIFVLSLRAGGSGLNLTRANHVFHYDRWWNPAVENQATDRAFRIGQLRNVQVHKFVVAGTLEERIHDLIESKQALAQSIVGSGEDWITELDTDQLRDLLMLRYDAIEDE